MDAPSWKQYAAGMCTRAWDLRPDAVERILAKIEALVTAGVLTEPAVAMVLHREGVTQSVAEAMAPSICMAVQTGDSPSALPTSWPHLGA